MKQYDIKIFMLEIIISQDYIKILNDIVNNSLKLIRLFKKNE